MEVQGRQQATDLISQTRSVLSPLHARAIASRETARTIEEQYASIRSATDNIVRSLQSEDIARQRVEHIQEALRQASMELEAGGDAEKCAGIIFLQRSQLLGTRDLVVESMGSVLDNLRSLGPQAEELTGKTAALASQTDQDGRSFAAAINDGLTAVSSVFAKYSASAHTVVSIVDSVLPSVAAMTKNANELEDIETSIHLIALNAVITTTRLGSKGAPMGVLSSELQRISAQSKEHTLVVLEHLRAMDHALSEISRHKVASAASVLMSSGVEDVKQKVKRLAESVTRSSQAMSVQLTALLTMARALRDELRSASELAGRASVIAEAFDAVLQKMNQTLEQLGYRQDVTIEAQEAAAKLSELYSMQSERDVHQHLFGGVNGNPQGPVEMPSVINDDLGDNVELF